MGRSNAAGDELIGLVIDKCRILSRLGHGSMSNVYLAEHTGLQRRVAIKILPEELARSSGFVQRFRHEAISTARLEHPNIVQVHDVGAHEGMPYLIMQYVEGFSVAEILKRSERLDPKEAARVAREVARALSAAHAAGIVHRDIKPANILISEKNEVRLTDFGVAQDSSTGKPLKNGSALTGTPHYASPEQIDGKKATPRSDLYALGATLFTMIAGRPPFTGDTPKDVISKHIYQAPPRVSKYVPEIPKFLDDLILRLLNKDSDKRFQTAEEVERELDRFVRGTYVRSRRETSSAKPKQSTPLPLPILLLAAGGALALIVLLILLTSGGGEPAPEGTAKMLRDAAAAEKVGDFNTAIALYRELGDEEGIRRASKKRRERREQDALRKINDAYNARKMKVFRTLAADFLREFPDSPNVAGIRAKLGQLNPGDPDGLLSDDDFRLLYRGPRDNALWKHTGKLTRYVRYTPEVIEVSVPATSRASGYLILQQPAFEEGIFRFEIMVNSGKASLGFGRFPPEARKGVTPLSLGTPMPGEYATIEVVVKGGRVRVSSRPFILDEKTIASPSGQLGFVCEAGAKYCIRNPRLRVGKTSPR